MTETKKALLNLIYHTLLSESLTSSAKSLLKEASDSIEKKGPTPLISLTTIYGLYLEQKKQEVSKEESSSDSSDTSSSESESEDEKPVAKAPAAKVVSTKVTPPAKKADSSSDSDSGSESDAPAPKKAAVPAPKKAESSDSDDSSSEDEKPKPKAVPAAKPTPAKKVESDSSDSDSSSEEEAPKVSGNKRKAESDSDSSSSSESESEDEKPAPKPVATPKKVEAPPAKKQKAESTPAAKSASAGEHTAYIRGLPWTSSDVEIKAFFDNKDIVEVDLPLDETGRSSGTALVSFGSRGSLDAALAKDGQCLPGSERWLKITEGKPARKSIGGAPDASTRPEGCDTVFVGNLPWDVDEAQMYELFGQCGEVAKVRFATSAEDGSFKGFGHVQFTNADSVDEAVKLYGTDLNGRPIRVDYAPPRNRESLGGGRGEGGRGRGGRDSGRGRGRDGGRGRGTPTTGNKNKGTIASAPAGKKIAFDE